MEAKVGKGFSGSKEWMVRRGSIDSFFKEYKRKNIKGGEKGASIILSIIKIRLRNKN